MTIQRYSGHSGDLEKDNAGGWVRWEDAAALETELEHTRQQLRGEEIVSQGYFRERNALETERDQARGLLLDVLDNVELPEELANSIEIFCTNPATATPDHPVNQDCVMLGCHGVVVEDEPATPAAMGVELTRWTPCVVDSEDEDGPVYQGFLTDPNGEWVKWEDLQRAAEKEQGT